MKVSRFLPISALMLLAACGSTGENQSAVKDDQGTVNDLPNEYLLCNETVNGADVLDGAKILTISKDQFGVYSAQLVQKDQFSGDSVLASILSMQRTTPGIYEIFSGAENGSSMKVTVSQIGNALKANLLLKTPEAPNGANIGFRCTKSGATTPPPASNEEKVLWTCEGQQGTATVYALIKEESDGTISGLFTRNKPNANGSANTHSWILQDLSKTAGGGFSPSHRFTKDAEFAGDDALDMFVNFNNSSATDGFGHITFTALSVSEIDADITCTRSH